jgi:hypothetical protein
VQPGLGVSVLALEADRVVDRRLGLAGRRAPGGEIFAPGDDAVVVGQRLRGSGRVQLEVVQLGGLVRRRPSRQGQRAEGPRLMQVQRGQRIDRSAVGVGRRFGQQDVAVIADAAPQSLAG